MERLRLRGIVLGVLLLAAGIWIQTTPRVGASTMRTEAWLEQVAPTKAGSFRVDSAYKMDETTYSELKPHGIVARRFGDGLRTYDVVLIASNRKESFHDPRVCFVGQGWNLLSQTQKTISTSRGPIPITVAKMSHEGQGQRIAAFFYKGPGGFYATPQSLTFQWLLRQLKGETENEAVFYRFIPDWDGATEDELSQFISVYLESADASSNGYF